MCLYGNGVYGIISAQCFMMESARENNCKKSQNSIGKAIILLSQTNISASRYISPPI